VAAPGRILVVDDDPGVGAVLSEFFTGKGFEVVTAQGGLEALSRLERDRPDAILLDVRMPDLDGIEVLRRVREANPWVGVLMMSANDDVVAARETLALGAFDYVLKPFDFPYLERAVHKMLTAAAPAAGPEAAVQAPEPSPQGLLYDLALETFKATRALPAVARASLGASLETAALAAVQKGVSGEKPEVVRALNHLRMLIRFARDLGDLSDEQHRHLEGYVVRARRSAGLSG
jgi:DNA-binding response OmpR family regulator